MSHTNRRLLLDAHDGITQIAHVGPTVGNRPGDMVIETVQDCEDIVGLCKILADEPPGKDFRHVAEIPMTVMDRAFREGWLHDEQAWKRWANDPENRDFRTWKGRI